MKCSVFIASSLDGFIARSDGGIDWLARVEVTHSLVQLQHRLPAGVR